MLKFPVMDEFRNIELLPLKKPYSYCGAVIITITVYFLEIFVFIMAIIVYSLFSEFQNTSTYISAVNNASSCVMISKVLKDTDALAVLGSISSLGYGYINPGNGGNPSDYICQDDRIGNYLDVLIVDAYFQTYSSCVSSLGVNCTVTQQIMKNNQTGVQPIQYYTDIHCNITRGTRDITLLSESGQSCRATSAAEIDNLMNAYYVPSACVAFQNHPPYACTTTTTLPPLGILSLSISLAFGFFSVSRTLISVFGKVFRTIRGDYSTSRKLENVDDPLSKKDNSSVSIVLESSQEEEKGKDVITKSNRQYDDDEELEEQEVIALIAASEIEDNATTTTTTTNNNNNNNTASSQNITSSTRSQDHRNSNNSNSNVNSSVKNEEEKSNVIELISENSSWRTSSEQS